MIPSHSGLHHKRRRTVDIGGGQFAAGVKHRIGLGQTGRAGAGDHGRVVGAGDGHRDGLRGAIGGGHGDAVGNDLRASQ